MPRLILFVACERVLIDQNQLPSAIGIFQAMKFQLQDAPLPENAISPVRWAIFALWKHTGEERGVQFTQHIEILKPSGEVFGVPTRAVFTLQGEVEQSQSKVFVDVFGLPVGQPGTVKIRTWLENVPNSAGEYEFLVMHLPKEKNGDTTATPPTKVN